MSVRTYNPSVRVGNWNEDICLEEDLLKDFLGKKERGELLIQKTHNLLSTILKEVSLSVSTDGFIHFGDTCMLVNPGQENTPPSLHDVSPPRRPTALAVNVDEHTMFNSSQVEGPCAVSASHVLNPCIRNAFVITSLDGSEAGTPLKYGQPFAISSTDGYAGNLKLFSDHARFNLSAKKSREQIVQLVDEISYLTSWKVLAFHPQHRLECEGLPVPANCKITIVHCKTGNALSLPSGHGIKTPFGREFEVSANTVLDSHKAEKDNNHWVIVTGNPSGNTDTHLDRPDPQPSGGAPKAE